MKLPPTAPPKPFFVNAPGSTIPQEYALEARRNPEAIKEMAETPQELRELNAEALARQYVFIIDRSGSMTSPDGGGSKTRWDSAQSAIEKMVDAVFRYDIDHSVPLYVFDYETIFVGELANSSQVREVFSNYKPRRGTTNLDGALKEALGTYAGSKRPNYYLVPGTTFIVLLDGGADDESAVFTTLRYYADPKNGFVANHTQIAISFLQIGNDPSATKFLQALDDNIEPDICDTKLSTILDEPGGLDRLLYDAIFD